MENSYKHIILISIDTLRADCITAVETSDFIKKYGPKNFSTKSLNNIVKKGTFFTNCISAAPYTTASHAAYFTGCWPKNNGVYEFFNQKLKKPTIFEFAKNNQYRTIFQTDFPIILGETLGFTKDVDDYFIEDEISAFDKLKNSTKKTVSFFHFGGVHYPYGFHKLKFAGKDYIHKVESLEKELSVSSKDKLDDILVESYYNNKDRELLSRYKRIVDKLYREKKYNRLKNLYIEGIDYFMENRFNSFIKKIVDFTDSTGSLLVIFADHGEEWDDLSRGHANSISDTVLRVPLIFYGKGIPKGVINDSLVRTIDLLPTISNLFNIETPQLDGVAMKFTKEKKNTNNMAISQVWRLGDKDKIAKHQQMMINKEKVAPLQTLLEKESIYFKNVAFKRIYNKEGTTISEKTYYNNGKQLINSVDTQNEELIIMKNLLEKYNSKGFRKVEAAISLPKRLIKELRMQGYKIK